MIEKGAVIFNAEGSCVNSVLGKQQYKQQIITLSIAWLNRLDDILNSEELQQLGVEEKDKIRELFDQGVKHKMKMNFVRQMSKTSGLLYVVLQKVPSELHPKVRSHGEGPYQGLLLVESGYYRFHI